MKSENLCIKNSPMISAVYYALLQNGYDFYSIERDADEINKLQSFLLSDSCEHTFFSDVRQNGCEVYPYWPRAAMLESATFFIDLTRAHFIDFDGYRDIIQSSKNISDKERDQRFWSWISQFPAALRRVMQSECFRHYLEWENEWVEAQNDSCKNELGRISGILDSCTEKFGSPFRNIQIVINPIKCVYSSDYHHINGEMTICLGALREESVIHEFIHHIVHPAVEDRKDDILRCRMECLEIDPSYFLDGGDEGKWNAFEEYMVRKLTSQILNGHIPENMNAFLDHEMMYLK